MSDSETVSWQFVSRRLDAVQADTADMRRRMIGLEERFAGVEHRMDNLDLRMSSMERRQSTLEERINHLTERVSGLQTTAAQTLFLLQRLALKVGGIEDEEPP